MTFGDPTGAHGGMVLDETFLMPYEIADAPFTADLKD